MHDYVIPVLLFLAELPVKLSIPINFWFWLLIITAPGLVLFVDVNRSIASHVTRVFYAIGLTYCLINLSIHADRSFDRKNFRECQENSVHRDMSPEMHEECGHHVDTADGAQNGFALLFGWVPAAIYVGFCELIWRIRHRKTISTMGREYRGKWFSNIIISFIFTSFMLFAIMVAII